MAHQRAFCVPALVSSFIACILLLLCTISTPTTFHTSTPFNFVQASNLGNITDGTNNTANHERLIIGLKLGSWGYCSKGAVSESYNYCSNNHHGYSITLVPSNTTQDSQAAYGTTQIKSGWTRGLVVVVVAFCFAIVGFILSFIPHLSMMLLASFIHLLAFLLALIAFILQIVLYIYTRNRVHQVTDNASIIPGPGFYMTLVSLPLLFFSALTVCCGWRKAKGGENSYTSSLKSSRFGKRSAAAAPSTIAGNDQDFDYSTGGDKIPLQSSRQRVLEAFRSDK